MFAYYLCSKNKVNRHLGCARFSIPRAMYESGKLYIFHWCSKGNFSNVDSLENVSLENVYWPCHRSSYRRRGLARWAQARRCCSPSPPRSTRRWGCSRAEEEVVAVASRPPSVLRSSLTSRQKFFFREKRAQICSGRNLPLCKKKGNLIFFYTNTLFINLLTSCARDFVRVDLDLYQPFIIKHNVILLFWSLSIMF